jgi:hypothetical protein
MQPEPAIKRKTDQEQKRPEKRVVIVQGAFGDQQCQCRGDQQGRQQQQGVIEYGDQTVKQSRRRVCLSVTCCLHGLLAASLPVSRQYDGFYHLTGESVQNGAP